MKLPRDFRDLLEEFARGRVEYVVIGGYAFAFHAEPRATKDLDLLLGPGEENLARAADALARYGAPPEVVLATRNLGDAEVAYFGRAPLRVDLLRTVDGVATHEILERAEAATWDGTPVKIIAIDDLITNKRASARPQDLSDVARLERVRQTR